MDGNKALPSCVFVIASLLGLPTMLLEAVPINP